MAVWSVRRDRIKRLFNVGFGNRAIVGITGAAGNGKHALNLLPIERWLL
jgi:hypothetical protein